MLRRSDSQQNHYEHQILIHELKALEGALEGLVCHSEVYASLATAQQVYRCGRYLYHNLPTHFANEEQKVLENLRGLGPNWDGFVREMRGQHLKLHHKLERFLSAIDNLGAYEDLETAVDEVQRRGRDLIRDLLIHMRTEELRLSTISTHS